MVKRKRHLGVLLATVFIMLLLATGLASAATASVDIGKEYKLSSVGSDLELNIPSAGRIKIHIFDIDSDDIWHDDYKWYFCINDEDENWNKGVDSLSSYWIDVPAGKTRISIYFDAEYFDDEDEVLRIGPSDTFYAEFQPLSEYNGFNGNHTFASAATIDFGKAYEGSSAANEDDYYAFTVSKPGVVDISVLNNKGETSNLYSIYREEADSQKTKLVSCYSCDNFRSRVAPGKYYVCISSNIYDLAEYTLTVDYTDESAGYYEQEANDSSRKANPIIIGEKYIGNICGNDKDWFKVNMNSGNLSLEIWTPYNSKGSATAKIYDASISQIASLNTGTSSYAKKMIAVSDGDYYICLSGDLECKYDYTFRCNYECSEHKFVEKILKEPELGVKGEVEKTCIICDYTETVELPAKEIKPVTGFTGKLTKYNAIDFSWKASENATGYNLYLKKGSGGYEYKGYIETLSKKFTELSAGYKYTLMVIPCIKQSDDSIQEFKGSYAEKSVYTLKKPSMNAVTRVSATTAKVSWKDISGESGYQICRMIKKDGKYVKKASYTTTAVSKTITANTGYNYYKVRAYKKYSDGTIIYGPWSTIKSYKNLGTINSEKARNIAAAYWKLGTGYAVMAEVTAQTVYNPDSGKYVKAFKVFASRKVDNHHYSTVDWAYVEVATGNLFKNYDF